MEIDNDIGIPHLLFGNTDADGRAFDILVVKESYSLSDDLDLVRRPEPELLTFADTYFGDPNSSSIHMPTDIVPFKPRGEILVAAIACSPGGKLAPSIPFSVVCVGERRMEVRLRAYGTRQWEPRLTGWRLTDPELISNLPVIWDYAYGGSSVLEDESVEVLHENPIGLGWRHDEAGELEEAIPAPQIVFEGDKLDRPGEQMTPAGFGAIPPAWLPRRPLGGTYDDNWVKNIAPNWAPDYDFAFHNAAPRGMQLEDFFLGDERLVFHNLRSDTSRLDLNLPGTGLLLEAERADGAVVFQRLAADTLFVDLLPEWPGACLISLTWRLVMAPGAYRAGKLRREELTSPVWAASAPPPHPSELFSDDPLRESA